MRKILFPYVAVILILLSGCSRTPSYWLENGTVIRNSIWEIPIADSTLVLQEQEGIWILPQPPERSDSKLTVSRYIESTGDSYSQLFGSIDQEVIHENGVIQREFYRFSKMGVEMLGYEGLDSTSQFTVYHPPMILIPATLQQLDSTFIHEQVPQIWDATTKTFRQDQKTRIRLMKIEEGDVLLDSVAVPAFHCKMSLSRDETVAFGETDLVVPDAFMMESQMLIAEGIGPVLEWGIRARRKPSTDAGAVASIPRMGGPDSPEEREYYIEVTLHQVDQ